MYEKLIVMRAKKKQKDLLHVTYAGQGEFYLLNVIRTYICLSFLYSHLKISDLIVHLQSVHDYPVEVEQLHFPAITEFLSWKADEEKKCIRHMSKNVPQGPSIQLSIGIIIVTAQGYTGTETQA